MVESAWLAWLAAAGGSVFAWWSAPLVVGHINPPDNPARLALPADWRVLGAGLAVTFGAMLLFGLAPALRASSVKPAIALKGGDDPSSRRRLMRGLVGAQVAFCFIVLFIAGLFVITFERLTNQPTGFSAERLLTLDTVAQPAQSPVFWEQVAAHLRRQSGIEKVALAGWPLLSGTGSNGFIAVNGAPPHEILAYFLNVSPGWLDTMKIPLISGRDFVPSDTAVPSDGAPGKAIVNEAFAKEYFHGDDPVGKSFERTFGSRTFEIVGWVRDARYRNMREPITPTAYIPFRYGGSEAISHATFLVRTASPNPLALAPMLRQEVVRERSGFRVSNIRTQAEINQSQNVRERLLAMLALFFGTVALLLAGIGMYGILAYSVVQRRREIGIRMAVGAQAGDIARRVTGDVFVMVLAGALAGVAAGMAAVRYIESLLYQVKPTDPGALTLPAMAILATALLAALPAVIRAVRIDPAEALRTE
jgi:predicted permease